MNSQPLSLSTNTQPCCQTGQMIELYCEDLSVWCICMQVIIMSRTSFRVSPHSMESTLFIWCLLWARSSWTFSQAIECEFTLKLVPDIIIRYSHMHRTDKYSQYSSIIRPVWLNGWVFVCELSGCRFESHCCQLNVRYDTCFEQGVPWHSGKLSSVDALWNLYVTW